MSERQEGWYWIEYGRWQCAHWDGAGWHLLGISEPLDTTRMTRIGHRIPTPDEPWQTVPVEPDAAMSTEGGAAVRVETTAINKLWTAGKVWKAMLAAAPKPGGEQ